MLSLLQLNSLPLSLVKDQCARVKLQPIFSFSNKYVLYESRNNLKFMMRLCHIKQPRLSEINEKRLAAWRRGRPTSIFDFYCSFSVALFAQLLRLAARPHLQNSPLFVTPFAFNPVGLAVKESIFSE